MTTENEFGENITRFSLLAAIIVDLWNDPLLLLVRSYGTVFRDAITPASSLTVF